jgi:hypothetical protein
MPFESSKTGPRGAESFSSPELESLADQLDRDAQWLATKYPAHKPRLPLERPRRVRWVAVGAAAALVFLAVDAWWMWTRPAVGIAPVGDFVAAPTPPVSVPGSKAETPASRRMLETRLPAVPGMPFNGLNGAEKEAVLDLLEQRAPEPNKTSLSF